MGFFTMEQGKRRLWIVFESQSLSGWDGVFHLPSFVPAAGIWPGRNPFQGGMGFFTYGLDVVEVGRISCRNPFQGGMGFFTDLELEPTENVEFSRNPFQGGMGFFTVGKIRCRFVRFMSQSLSGWDGVFHSPAQSARSWSSPGRNPFQGGMGFFTLAGEREDSEEVLHVSQSLSGWDGVFHCPRCGRGWLWPLSSSQSLSGWDGVFHMRVEATGVVPLGVAIPFRVGWGFSQASDVQAVEVARAQSQSLSGWDGVFHEMTRERKRVWVVLSQSLSGWDGVFHVVNKDQLKALQGVAIPFRVGWGFSLNAV